MTKKCDLTAVGAQAGNNVSHSKRKTRRIFGPNLHNVSLYSDVLKRSFNVRVTAATLRSVDHNGGLDNFLLTANNSGLSEEAIKLKRKIRKSKVQDPKDIAAPKRRRSVSAKSEATKAKKNAKAA